MSYPCFPNTDVPIACLFIHLQHGYTTHQFLQDFPGVSEEWVEQVLDLAITSFKAPTMDRVFENGMNNEKSQWAKLLRIDNFDY